MTWGVGYGREGGFCPAGAKMGEGSAQPHSYDEVRGIVSAHLLGRRWTICCTLLPEPASEAIILFIGGDRSTRHPLSRKSPAADPSFQVRGLFFGFGLGQVQPDPCRRRTKASSSHSAIQSAGMAIFFCEVMAAIVTSLAEPGPRPMALSRLESCC